MTVDLGALTSYGPEIATAVPIATVSPDSEIFGTAGGPYQVMVWLYASTQPAAVLMWQTTVTVPGVPVKVSALVPWPLTTEPFVTVQAMLPFGPGSVQSVAVAFVPAQ